VRYLLLLNGTAEAHDQWERNTPEENARLRAEEIPKWGAFMRWAEEKGLDLKGLELDSRSTAKSIRVRNGQATVTDGPFAETKDLIAGWMVIDVETYERALELAAELSAAPGAGGKPVQEWLEVRPFLTAMPTVTE
jgi:hypothetical protein